MRLTEEAVADARTGKVNCIVAGGGDGTINEVFATARQLVWRWARKPGGIKLIPLLPEFHW
jgi:diacylglycerol kinase family enzyme